MFPLLFLKLSGAQNYLEECEAGEQGTVITKDSVHHIKNIVDHFKGEPGGKDIITFAHWETKIFNFNQ